MKVSWKHTVLSNQRLSVQLSEIPASSKREKTSVLMHECGALWERFLPVKHVTIQEKISLWYSSKELFSQRSCWLLHTEIFWLWIVDHLENRQERNYCEHVLVGTYKLERIFQINPAILFVAYELIIIGGIWI